MDRDDPLIQRARPVHAAAPGRDIGLLRRVASVYRRGPGSLLNLSLYAAGLTGLWTAVTFVIIQFRLLAIVDPSQKIVALTTITLVGLVFPAIVQPVAGGFSDRSRNRLGKRGPYILFGGGGLAIATMLVGFADSFMSLLLAYCLMQVMGNIAQGPANALLIDHVPVNRRGAAAGALTFARSIGAGIAVVGTLLLLSHAPTQEMSLWMWLALALISGMALLSAVWTSLAIRPRPDSDAVVPGPEGPADETEAEGPAPRTREFIWFLAAFTIATGTMSVLSRFAIFFLQDVVGLENPARGALILSISVVGGVALSVLPAGILSDRMGRMPILLAGGLVGSVSVASLAFIDTLPALVVAGLAVGVSSGALLSVAWALANDLVKPSKAGRNLSYTSTAMLFGAGIPLAAGILVEVLNRRADDLGYRVMIGAVAIAFVIFPLMLIRLKAARVRRRP